MKTIIFLLLISFNFSFVFASDIKAQDILGEWWSPEKDARIEISEKDGLYQGHLSWLKPEDEEKLDDKNPDPELKTKKLKGLVILKNFKFDGHKWGHGTIYDPKNGKTYSCKMNIDKDNKNLLKIRGYVGISLFGRSEVFTKFETVNARQ